MRSQAILFQRPGGVYEPTPSAHSAAVRSCSRVRVSDRRLTSARAARNTPESKGGGGGARWSAADFISQGFTLPHSAPSGAMSGAQTQTPGPVRNLPLHTASAPSLRACSMTWAATVRPRVSPASMSLRKCRPAARRDSWAAAARPARSSASPG
jgi:hypothetical protein